jgi:uncharacterized membrane protein
MPQPWTIGDVLSTAWNVFTRNWMTLVFSQLIVGLIAAAPMMIAIFVGVGVTVASASAAQSAGTSEEAGKLAGMAMLGAIAFGEIMLFFVMAIFQARLVRIWIDAARGGQPQIGDLFKGPTHFLSTLGVIFLNGLLVGLGYVLLVVPGVILGIGLAFAQFFVADRGLGAVDAMKASWEATKGQKGQLFLFGLVAMLIVMVACFVPLAAYVVIPMLAVGGAIIYLRITGQSLVTPATMAPPAYGVPSYGAPPGGYGGPPGYGPPPPGGFGAPPR